MDKKFKIALAQLNPLVGDVIGNVDKLIKIRSKLDNDVAKLDNDPDVLTNVDDKLTSINVKLSNSNQVTGAPSWANIVEKGGAGKAKSGTVSHPEASSSEPNGRKPSPIRLVANEGEKMLFVPLNKNVTLSAEEIKTNSNEMKKCVSKTLKNVQVSSVVNCE